jgi:hypothetical protein
MNSTGESDLENYYNYVEKIQKLMLKKNLNLLIDVIIQAGLRSGDIAEEPKIRLSFNPLWSMSEAETAQIEAAKIQAQYVKAQTAQIYLDMGVYAPNEIRKGLAQVEDMAIEELLDETGAGEESESQPEALPETSWVTDENISQNSRGNLTTDGKYGILKAYQTNCEDGGPGSGRYPKGSGNLNDNHNISAIGVNEFSVGFSQENLDDHWIGGASDHSEQYPGYTKEQYAEEALALVQSATSETIVGYKNELGQVVRFDTENKFEKEPCGNRT